MRQKKVNWWTDLTPDQRQRAQILVDAGLSKQDAAMLVLMSDAEA